MLQIVLYNFFKPASQKTLTLIEVKSYLQRIKLKNKKEK